MAKHFTEEKLLHSAQSLFETLATREELAQELAEYTYDTDKIAEGKLFLKRQKLNNKPIKRKPKRKFRRMRSSTKFLASW